MGLLVFFLGRGDGAARPGSVPVEPEAERVARAFVRDAVRRRDLTASYRLVTPELRRGYSLARWRTGNIPVVPVRGRGVQVAPLRPRLSRPGHAVLEVVLRERGGEPEAFRIGLVRRGGRWLVSSWGPAGGPPPPAG